MPSLVGVSGFAWTFLVLGASVVIAPLWSVRDEEAYKVATAFYERAMEGGTSVPLAEIVRDIRRLAYGGATQGEDTYAAYCFYGDPSAVAKL
jgi:hypothetical protein